MTVHRYAVLMTIIVFFMLVGLSTSASSPTGGDYWVFVTAYGLIAVAALAGRYWTAAAAALVVMTVRAMIALKIGGAPFEVASSAFVALFFLVVQEGAWERKLKRDRRE